MSDDLPNEGTETNDLRTLRQKLKERDSELEQMRAQAEAAAAAQRKLAFAEAGVPLSDPKAKYFVNGYDGDQTADAIKAEWASFSGTAAQAPDHSADIAASERIAAASAGAGAPDPATDAKYREELHAAKTPEAAMDVMRRYQKPIAWEMP